MMVKKVNSREIFQTFIHVNKEVRHAENLEQFGYVICNSTKKLVPYHQAVFWEREQGKNKYFIRNVSSAVNVSSDSPYLSWLQDVIKDLASRDTSANIQAVTERDIPSVLAKDWHEWMPAYALWCPIQDKDGIVVAGLWLVREVPWEQYDLSIMDELIDAYTYSYRLLAKGKRKFLVNPFCGEHKLLKMGVAAVFLTAIACIPVRQTVLAPAEIVSKNPVVVTAALNGVVKKVHVESNTHVKKGQLLMELDSTELDNEFEIEKSNFKLASEKLRKANQLAFDDARSRSELVTLRNEVKKIKQKLRYLNKLRDNIKITAPQEGVALIADKNDWVGKPIVIGEKLMSIADPAKKELDVWLGTNDSITFQHGAKMKVYLNVDPLHPIKATLSYVSYSAKVMPDKTLAYLVKGYFPDTERVPRIGLKGTAKIYGDRVALFYYVLWRPISSLRRSLGL